MLARPLEGRWPDLTAPFLIVAMQGWVDAGSAAQVATVVLRQAWNLERIGLFELDEFLDYQHRRPQVRLDESGQRRIEWPEIELLAGSAGLRDAVLLTGPEPARMWPSFCGAVVDAALALRVQEVYALGGIPTPVPHRRPVGIAVTASHEDVAGRYETLLGPYEGPTGIHTTLQVAFGDAGIPAVSLWAQVPHYLSAAVWPGGAAALLQRLSADTGTEVSVGELLEADARRRQDVERAVSERPDVEAMVRALEEGMGGVALPTGDELADEIERFLREGSDG